MKNNFRFIILKSFLRDWKHFVSIAIVCVLSSYLLLNYAYLTMLSKTVNDNEIEQKCGYYDIELANVESTVIDKIIARNYVEDYCICNNYFGKLGEISADIREVKESYFRLSSYYFVEGEFPESENEIMCEPSYLRSIGIESSDMIGSIIVLDGKEHIVTGLFVDKLDVTYSEKSPVILKVIKENANALLLDVKEEDIEFAFQDIAMLVDEEVTGVYENYEKRFVEKNTDQSYIGIMGFVFMVLAISSVSIIINFINLFINQVRKRINAYIMLGISHNTISGVIVTVISLVIVIFDSVGLGAFYITAEKFQQLIAKKYEHNYTFGEVRSDIALGIFVGMLIIELVLIGFIVVKLFWSRFYRTTGKLGGLYEVKSGNKKSKYFCLNVARNGLKLSKKINIFTIITISLTILGYVGINYFVYSFTASRIDYGDTKYIVKTSGYDVGKYVSDEKQMQLVNALMESDVLDAYTQNIYKTTMNIPKDKISKKFEEYLKKDADYAAVYQNNFTKEVPVSIGLIAESEVKNYINVSLADDEMIMYEKFSNNSYKKPLDVIQGEEYLVGVRTNKGQMLKIAELRKETEWNIFSKDVMCIIVVNDKVFNEISSGFTPDRVYIKGDVSESEVIKITKNFPFAMVENIEQDQKDTDTNLQVIEFVLGVLLAICLVVVAVSLTTTCIIRTMVFSKEYATLNALGISNWTIARIPMYEFGMILAPILIISTLGSYVITKMMYINLQEYIPEYYSFPIETLLKTDMIVVSIIVLCIIIATIKVSKQTYQKVLAQNC